MSKRPIALLLASSLLSGLGGCKANEKSASAAKTDEATGVVAGDTGGAAAGTAAYTYAPDPATGTATATASGDGFKDYGTNAWTDSAKDRLSTFAADVDTASYTIARRKLTEGSLPPAA